MKSWWTSIPLILQDLASQISEFVFAVYITIFYYRATYFSIAEAVEVK